MHGSGAFGHQGHPTLAPRDQKCSKIEAMAQFSTTLHKGAVIHAPADNSFKLTLIGGEDRRSSIALELSALRVHDYRQSKFASVREQLLDVSESAFPVIGKNHRMDAIEGCYEVPQVDAGAGAGEAVFDIHPEDLLMPAQDSGLRDGLATLDLPEVATHTVSTKKLMETLGVYVIARQGKQARLGSHARNVDRDVPGATHAGLLRLDQNDWNRSLGRNPGGRTVPVDVQHDVASYEHATRGEVGYGCHGRESWIAESTIAHHRCPTTI